MVFFAVAFAVEVVVLRVLVVFRGFIVTFVCCAAAGTTRVYSNRDNIMPVRIALFMSINPSIKRIQGIDIITRGALVACKRALSNKE